MQQTAALQIIRAFCMLLSKDIKAIAGLISIVSTYEN